MDSLNNLDFKIPFQLTKTLAAARHSVADRGLGLSALVIKIETQNSEAEISRAAEARANQLLGREVDKTV